MNRKVEEVGRRAADVDGGWRGDAPLRLTDLGGVSGGRLPELADWLDLADWVDMAAWVDLTACAALASLLVSGSRSFSPATGGALGPFFELELCSCFFGLAVSRSFFGFDFCCSFLAALEGLACPICSGPCRS